MSKQLPDETTIGRVALTVSDLDRSLAFYRDTLGFQLQSRENGVATLGAGDVPLLRLHGRPNVHRPSGPTTGLYHFAILLPRRRHLAHALHHLAQSGTPLQGFADHFVSEAVYLADPDGNGIEIYRDRDRAKWSYRNGQLQIGTAPLNVDDLLTELTSPVPPWSGLPLGTTIGHVHLHVADLRAAETFYRQIVGFDLVMHYGSSAAFLSAGGYHHHLGINTWAGASAPPPAAGAVGLRWYELLLPEGAQPQLLARARDAGLSPVQREGTWYLSDPSQNLIRLTAFT